MSDYKELNKRYDSWVVDPTPENLNSIVDQLKPTIDHNLRSINAVDDNLMRTRARTVAAQAVQSYDPSAGTQLPTWTSNQLMRLRRMRREIQQPIRVPERTQIDAFALNRAELEFMEKHNREPDVEELADWSHMPVRRIEKIRRQYRRMPGQAALGDSIVQTETDYGGEALEYIYKDADKLDRQIIEMKTGYGGKYDPMEPKDIAYKLKLTPSQLSRRSAKLSLKIQEIEEALIQTS